MGHVVVASEGPVWTISVNRPERRNAVDYETAGQLAAAFRAFDDDPEASVAILTGSGDCFCAGADLHAFASGKGNEIGPVGEVDGPMGPTRMRLKKPVIAAVEGPAVAGGLELALWADLRVASTSSVFGVFCRRWGVPLIDGGTVRLPRIIGLSRAMDLILTGREVSASEAFSMGLVNRLAQPGHAFAAARELAHQLSKLPQRCMQNDRSAMLAALSSQSEGDALCVELQYGQDSLKEAKEGAARFSGGAGRHGLPAEHPSLESRTATEPVPSFPLQAGGAIDTVVFDLGGVLLDSPLQVIQAVERHHRLDPGSVLRLLHALGSSPSGAWSRLERGEATAEEFADALANESHQQGLPAIVDGIDFLDRLERLTPRPAMLSAVREIRSQGFRTAVLTNNFANRERSPPAFTWLQGCMDDIIESWKVGVRKPEPAIFELTQRRLQTEPHRIAFLDDIGSNLKAARRLGWNTVHVGRDPTSALRELGKVLGIDLVRSALRVATRGRS